MKRTTLALLLCLSLVAVPGCATIKNWFTSPQTIQAIEDGLAVAQGLVDLVNIAVPALGGLLPPGVGAAALAAAQLAQQAIDAAKAYLAANDPTSAQAQLQVAQVQLQQVPVMQVVQAAKRAKLKAVQ